MRFLKAASRLLTFVIALLLIGNGSVGYAQTTEESEPESQSDYGELIEKSQDNGSVMVIVGLDLPTPFLAEGNLPNTERVEEQRAVIARTQQTLRDSLPQSNVDAYAIYDTIPYMALKVDEAALRRLIDSPLVSTIQEDIAEPLTLASSTAVIGMPTVWAAGVDGSGQTVVILDTGVEASHSFFGGRVVTEACFSNAGGAGGRVSLCPDGSGSQTGSGSSDPSVAACDNSGTTMCDHGTHVAGIAAGDGSSYDGVARGANIISIQVFTRFNNAGDCGGSAPCVRGYNSDQLLALEHVYNTLRSTYTIASVNMSLGGGSNSAYCDTDSRKAAIDNLRSANIATVIATGNDGYTNEIGAPACISTAVAVGSTTDADAVSSFSNMHNIVDLLAPGSAIDSSVLGNTFESKNGTSMATPHVAGAWAILKSINPTATVDDILTALQNTGVSVTDTRTGGSVTKPRIQVDVAARGLTPATWLGNSTSLNDSSNWSSGSVPSCIRSITIPASPTGGNFPTVDANLDVGHLTIESGAQLDMSANTLGVCGDWNVQGTGTFNGTGGTVVFKGNVDQTITASANSTFNDVQIGDSTSQNVTLSSNLDVNGNLTLSAGATLSAGSNTMNVAGNWDDGGNGFVPGTSTVIFDGSSQTVDKVTTSTLLNEPFDEADGQTCCNAAHLPSGWTREHSSGFGFMAGQQVSSGEAIRWNDSSDAWLHTTGFELEPGVTYDIQYKYANVFASGTNDFSLSFGTSPSSADMTTLLHSVTGVSSTSFTTGSATFTVPTAGTYYFGIRSQINTNTGNNYAMVDDVMLTETKNLTFYDLTTNSSAQSVTFNKDVAVQNNLVANANTEMDFGTNNVTVEGTVTNNGSLKQTKDASTVSTTTDYLTIQNAAADTTKYYGINITPTGGSLGSTAVIISGNRDCVTPVDPELVRRCFDITPTTATDATIKFWFAQAEQNGRTANTLKVWDYNGTAWVQAGAPSPFPDYGACSSDATCWAEWHGIDSFSPMALGDGEDPPTGSPTPPLAVQLGNFSAVDGSDHVLLTWQTVSEQDNLGFNLYRSANQNNVTNGIQLNEVLISAQVPGSGQGSVYEYQDYEIEAGMTYFYRVEDVDVNGNGTLHGPISISLDMPTAIMTSEVGAISQISIAWALAPMALMLLMGGMLIRRRQRRD